MFANFDQLVTFHPFMVSFCSLFGLKKQIIVFLTTKLIKIGKKKSICAFLQWVEKCNVWTERMLFSKVWLQKCGNLPKQSHFINDERYHPGGGGPRITSFFVIYYHMTEQYSILYYIQSILVRYCCKILL